MQGGCWNAGRELPPADVLAADQRVTWWARQLNAAGLAAGMDQLRARAYLDILLGTDSRPGPGAPGSDAAGGPDQPGGGGLDGPSGGPDGPGDGRPGPAGPAGPSGPDGSSGGAAPAGPLAGAMPPGFAGRVTLTIPLATLIGLAARPGEITGIGPVDPALARDLAAAAARNPRFKQDPRWTAEKLADGSVRWTTPAGRRYATEPTRYPI